MFSQLPNLLVFIIYCNKHLLVYFFQFQPSTPYFAPDNINYYKIISDAEGYKHIHYINDTQVSNSWRRPCIFMFLGSADLHNNFCLFRLYFRHQSLLQVENGK